MNDHLISPLRESPASPTSPPSMALPVTRHAHFSVVTQWQCLACGLDSLDVGISVQWGRFWELLVKQLEEGKERASGSEGLPSWDHQFLIHPGGKGPNYRWHLQWPGFHLYIGKSQSPKRSTPNVYASISAKSLWHSSPQASIQAVIREVESLGGEVLHVKPSRCDLAADFLVPGGFSLPFLLEHRVPEHVRHSHHMTGEQLETFYHGAKGSPLQCRIYDKGLEVHQGGVKNWFLDIWGVESLCDVWRVEFQVRRPVLKQFRIHSMSDLHANLSGLWSYLTEKWFSLRLPDNANASRRTVHPWWEAVQACAERLGQQSVLSRKTEHELASEERYVSLCSGCLCGFAVRRQIPDFEEAARQLVKRMREHWQGKDFAKAYAVKSIRLGFAGSPARDEETERVSAGKDA